MLRRQPFLFLSLSLVFLLPLATIVGSQQVDPKTYSGMKWRLIGPFRGGRVIAVTGVPSQPEYFLFRRGRGRRLENN